MNRTSLSLLERIRQSADSESWNRLVELYAPLIRGWLRSYGVSGADEEWKMGSDGVLHVKKADGRIVLYRINGNNSLTAIGYIIDGQRVMLPKDEQRTCRKITEHTR